MAVAIQLIPEAEFRRVMASVPERDERLTLVADMCRANALSAVKRAGSGHLGSSFSAMDIVVWLYYQRMNIAARRPCRSGPRHLLLLERPRRPRAVRGVALAGRLSGEQLMQLRRYGGLDGHPDIGVPGIEANSGSLGMGISKGRGIAWAKRARGSGATST